MCSGILIIDQNLTHANYGPSVGVTRIALTKSSKWIYTSV